MCLSVTPSELFREDFDVSIEVGQTALSDRARHSAELCESELQVQGPSCQRPTDLCWRMGAHVIH